MFSVVEDLSKTQSGTQRESWLERIPIRYWIVSAILLIMPLLVNDFALYQIFGWTFILGIISLSLMLLAGYGGMVSLAQ
ncbi:MAG: hypothetical protein AAGA76_03355, partial [Pseudomonadota bacterium]